MFYVIQVSSYPRHGIQLKLLQNGVVGSNINIAIDPPHFVRTLGLVDPKVKRFLIQMALVLDFAYEYTLAGHAIWQGIFLFRGPPAKPLLICINLGSYILDIICDPTQHTRG